MHSEIGEIPDPPAPPRAWFGMLSAFLPILGMCGCVGFSLAKYNPIRGSRVEATVNPGVLVWGCLGLAGIAAGVAALLRRERWRRLRITGLIGNAVLLFSLVSWWVFYAPQGPIRSRERTRSEEIQRREDEARELDRNHLRLRLSFFKTPEMMVLTHQAWKSDLDEYKHVGVGGSMTGSAFPQGVTANVVWLRPRAFELTLQCDNEAVALKFDAEKIIDASASCDGNSIAIPIDLPPAKRRIVISGRAP